MDDEELLGKLSQLRLPYTLHIDGMTFSLDEVSLTKSAIPVRKPTTRGGAYFTDTTAYKIKTIARDLSIIKLLPKLMLGPNTEFGKLVLKTIFELNGEKKDIVLETHVANTMNTKETLELNLIVDKINFG